MELEKIWKVELGRGVTHFVWRVCSVAGVTMFWCRASFGEFSCETSISYRWKRVLQKEGAADPESPPLEVSWLGLKAEGATEPETRAELNRRVWLERKKAERACEDRHQNLGRCASTRFEMNAGVLGQLGFAARKRVEEALMTSCTNEAGECLGASVAEVKCQEKAKPVEEAVPADKGKGKGGDKKK